MTSLKIATKAGWRPMDEAPKDGRWLVGFCGGREMYVIFRWCDGIFREEDDDFTRDESGYWMKNDGDELSVGECEGEVQEWIFFLPHPSAPPPTTCEDPYSEPYPSRAERGITPEYIDRHFFVQFARQHCMEAHWVIPDDFDPDTYDFDNRCGDCAKLVTSDRGKQEHYVVKDQVWKEAGSHTGFLCIECLESRLSRPLVVNDFDFNRFSYFPEITSDRIMEIIETETEDDIYG